MHWPPLLLTGAIIAGSANGAPDDWKLIKTPEQSPYELYIDMASVVREGPARTFKAKMIPSAPSSDPQSASDIASVLVRVKIDCGANTIETAAAKMVDQAGEASALRGDPPRQIKVGTDDMTLRDMVC